MSFEKKQSHHIPALQAIVEEYEESLSGAKHIHLATDSSEMAFLVAFPTFPETGDGRAHILEHLALCGSKSFPVRSTFFSMTSRSVASFMNAMTSSDWTAYPFASADRVDFFNLLDVYLDAAFFPRLDYLDFRQEGWRYELREGKLHYAGVVMNEMKSAFSDPLRSMYRGIHGQLFAGTSYAIEHGGDPLEIPALTHDALKLFHQTHYHPSQAVFMTSGNADISAVQDIIMDRVIRHLPGRAARMLPSLAAPWQTPKSAVIPIPATKVAQGYGVQQAWLLGDSENLRDYYRTYLLQEALFGDASSPLIFALENAGYGRPSDFNGMDAETRQIAFHIGMEGLNESEVGKARKLIQTTMEACTSKTVPYESLKSALRNLRFSQREVRSGSMPYGLRQLMNVLPVALRGGDVAQALNPEPLLQMLDEEIKDPAFITAMVRGLLDNPSRLDATIAPDTDFISRREKAEIDHLALITARLTEEDRIQISTESQLLLSHQRAKPDLTCLPFISPSTVSKVPLPAFSIPAHNDHKLALTVATNGLSHANIIYDVSDTPISDWLWLSFYADVFAEVGVANMSYDQASVWRQHLVPDFGLDIHAFQTRGGNPKLRLLLSYSAKGLREDQSGIAAVLEKSLASVRFNELDRLAFLIESMAEDVFSSLADHGDDYALLAAIAPLSPSKYFESVVEGVHSLEFLSGLQKLSTSKAGLESIADRLTVIHASIMARAPRILTAGIADDAVALADQIVVPLTDHQNVDVPSTEFRLPDFSDTAYHAPAQVNHCFAAWPAPDLHHADAPALTVLASLMSKQILHQLLREEGSAYGSQASYSNTAGFFILCSFSDPRFLGTYADFNKAIDWVLDTDFTSEQIEEAIIGVIKSLDRPQTPYAAAIHAWKQQQQGITEELRAIFRLGVLECSAQDIKRVAKAWLLDKPCSRSAFVGKKSEKIGNMQRKNLLDFSAK